VNAPGTGSATNREQLIAEVVEALNQLRGGAGLGPVFPDPALTAAAQLHAADMAARLLLTHTDEAGNLAGARIEAQGYRWWTVAENVAFGQRDAAEAMAAWTNSEGHRENMLLPAVTQVGMGIAANHLGLYWCMILARPS